MILPLLVSVGVFLLLPIGCTSDEGPTILPPSYSPDKGNPKLDSRLNQIVNAEKRGELATFAEQSNIKLSDGSVRVIIECLPGQLEAATQAATGAGAKIEASYENLLQALVPVASLSTLADAASIRFIRLPQQPLPAQRPLTSP